MEKIATVLKAITAFVASFGTYLIAYKPEVEDEITLLGGLLISLGIAVAVWVVPNNPEA